MHFGRSSFGKSDFKDIVKTLQNERADFFYGRDLTDAKECEKLLNMMNQEIYYKLQVGEKPQGQYRKCISEGKHRMNRRGTYSRRETEEKYGRLERYMMNAPMYKSAYGPSK